MIVVFRTFVSGPPGGDARAPISKLAMMLPPSGTLPVNVRNGPLGSSIGLIVTSVPTPDALIALPLASRLARFKPVLGPSDTNPPELI